MINGPESSNGSIGLLICDDQEDVRILLRIVIEHHGVTEGGRTLEIVGEARDGNEAVSEARRLQPDVILLDLSMPHLTGLEALPDIKKVAPAARIIVFSGFEASMMSADVLSRGVDRYLEKGAQPREITAAIEQVAALVRPV